MVTWEEAELTPEGHPGKFFSCDVLYLGLGGPDHQWFNVHINFMNL